MRLARHIARSFLDGDLESLEEGLESPFLLLELNVINQDVLKKFLTTFIDKVENPNGKKWLKSAARNYLLNSEEYNRPVDPKALDLEKAPDWLKKAVEQEQRLHVFTPSEELSDRLTNLVKYFNSGLPEVSREIKGSWEDIGKAVDDYLYQEGLRKKKELGGKAAEGQSDAELGIQEITRLGRLRIVRLGMTPAERRGGKSVGEYDGKKNSYCYINSKYRSLRDESGRMDICVGCGSGGYSDYDHYAASGDMKEGIFSVREEGNIPVVTIEINKGRMNQAYGYHNSEVKPKYSKVIRKFILDNGFQANDRFLSTLGMVNTDKGALPVEKIPPDTKISGNLDLSGMAPNEFQLNDGWTVLGNLDLSQTHITGLPARLTVHDRLNITGTEITELPVDLSVESLSWDKDKLSREQVMMMRYRKALPRMREHYDKELRQSEPDITDEELDRRWRDYQSTVIDYFLHNENIWKETQVEYG